MSRADAALSAWLGEHLGLYEAVLGPRLGGGNSNVTQSLSYRDGRCVLRRPPDNAISASAANGVRREYRMLQALHGRARVPRAFGFCEDAAVIGQPFLVVEHVDGVAITNELPAGYRDDPATLRALGEELVDAIAAVHALDWRTLGIEAPPRADTYVAKQIERCCKVRAAESVRELPLVEELGRWLLARLPTGRTAGVTHGDFHLDNTLFQRERPMLAAIIDWPSGAHAGSSRRGSTSCNVSPATSRALRHAKNLPPAGRAPAVSRLTTSTTTSCSRSGGLPRSSRARGCCIAAGW
jgi:aminoglycoside phosphotransferase (APT) family kinase protein